MTSLRVIEYILSFGLATLISFLFMPQVYAIAKNVKAIDDPQHNERKIHKKRIPRLGGLAIYISFLLAYTICGDFIFAQNYSTYDAMVINKQMNAILIASFLIVLMGIFDDISPVKAWNKLAVQILAACIVVFRGEFVVTNLFFYFEFPLYLGQIFTILWIITITNAINLSDGIDGLAGGLSFISLISMAIIGMLDGSSHAAFVILITLILAGSIVGFMPYNLPPAKIFMGDSGAQFIGFMIATLSILGYKQAAVTSFVTPIVILAVPLFDTVYAFFRRLITKTPTSIADANHVHHRVLHRTNSNKASLYWIYGLSMLFSISAISYSYNKAAGSILFVVVVIIAELFVEYFHIVGVRYSPLLYVFHRLFPNSRRDRKRQYKRIKTLRYQAQQKQQILEQKKLRQNEKNKLNK